MPTWYAIYSRPRTEKRVLEELTGKGIDTYLPLVKTLKQWSDRKKWVEEPLFRSYLFVNISEDEYYEVLKTNAVVRYITFEGKAVAIPPQQIEAIRMFIANTEEMPDNKEQYLPGKAVEVTTGALRGLEGELIEIKGKNKVKVEVAGVGQAVFLTLPMSHLRIVKTAI